MRLTILLLLIQICCMTALNFLDIPYDMDGFTLIFIAIITFALVIESSAIIRDKSLYIIFLAGMGMRLGLLFIDYYVLPIMHSGGDTEGFYAAAAFDTAVALTRGIYYRWLAVLFSVVGSGRLFAQYINLFAGLASCLIILKFFRVLGLSPNAQRIGFLLLCLLPNWADLSVILLRESLISFFVSLSLLSFALWHKRHKMIYAAAAMCTMIPAIDLHSGMVFFPIALITGFIAYDVRRRKLRLSAPTLLLLCASLIAVVLLIRRYGLAYLGTLSIENITRYSNYANVNFFNAGSTYLENLVSATWADVLLHTPIRLFYFFFSPLPTDFRGIFDAVAFTLSGVPIFAIFWYSIHALFVCQKHKLLLLFLLFAFVLGGIVHAWGVLSAGAAMRHRDKLVPLYVLVLAVAVDARESKRRYGALSPEAARALEQLDMPKEVTI